MATFVSLPFVPIPAKSPGCGGGSAKNHPQDKTQLTPQLFPGLSSAGICLSLLPVTGISPQRGRRGRARPAGLLHPSHRSSSTHLPARCAFSTASRESGAGPLSCSALGWCLTLSPPGRFPGVSGAGKGWRLSKRCPRKIRIQSQRKNSHCPEQEFCFVLSNPAFFLPAADKI